MSEHNTYMSLADGREVLIIFEVESYGSEPSGLSGPLENYDPGSGPELFFTKAVDEENKEIILTSEEIGQIEDILRSNPDWYTPDFDYEPDWDED